MAHRHFITLSLILGGSLLLNSTPGLSMDEEVAALRMELAAQVKAKEWKKAIATAKKIRRKVSVEERKEVDKTIFHIKGTEEYNKLHEAAFKTKNPQALFKKIDAFLKKYGKDEQLRVFGFILREVIKQMIYEPLEGFEGGVQDKESVLAVVSEPRLVKQGRRAARWESKSISDEYAYIFFDEHDWTHYTHLVFWLYAEKPAGRIAIHLTTDLEDFFEGLLNISWKGWKEVRLPLHGKKARFRRTGKADWKQIKTLRLWKEEGRRIQVVLDDFRLERSEIAIPRFPEKRNR